jgi:hypothetical protein
LFYFTFCFELFDLSCCLLETPNNCGGECDLDYYSHCAVVVSVGTAVYMSPERIQSVQYSYPADVWYRARITASQPRIPTPINMCCFLHFLWLP